MMSSIIDCKQWTPKTIDHLFKLSSFLQSNPLAYEDQLRTRTLINAFFEPSTRTMLSFESAMKKAGGNVITFYPNTSSTKKGESDHDTIKSLSQYGDAIVLRHPDASFIHEIHETPTTTPIINAGNGNEEHPTQALLDLYTLYKTFGDDYKSKPLKILFIGDIKESRTIHSFIELLHHYPHMNIHFLPYSGCEPSQSFIQKIAFKHQQTEEDILLEDSDMLLPGEYESSSWYLNYTTFDVVYITRLQKERHEETTPTLNEETTPTEEDHSTTSDTEASETSEITTSSPDFETFRFTNEHANKLHKDAIIMHPLPRNTELDPSVDTNPRAYYFKQMEYGVELRMGLLVNLFLQLDATDSTNSIPHPTRLSKYTRTSNALRDITTAPRYTSNPMKHMQYVTTLFFMSTMVLFGFTLCGDYCSYLNNIGVPK
jgi:aspartate carbamoyltransferase